MSDEMRKEILKKINEFILNEKGKKLKENNLLKDSEMDSFGYIVFWFHLDDEYPIFIDKDKKNSFYLEDIDYEKYTVRELIDTIEEYLKSKDKDVL